MISVIDYENDQRFNNENCIALMLCVLSSPYTPSERGIILIKRINKQINPSPP